MAKEKYGWYKGWWIPISNGITDESIDPFLLDRGNKINKLKENIKNGKTHTR